MYVRRSLYAKHMPVGIIVPAHGIEIYLANGWKLADEPGCEGARIIPPIVPPSQTTGGRDGP